MGKSYSETIKLNTSFNPSDILSGIKKIQQALSETASTRGKTMLGNVNLDIEKVERALRQMETQMEKGFGSDSEVKAFVKSMDQVENSVLQIHKDLKDVANVSLAEGAKDLEKQLSLIQKQVDNLKKSFNTDMFKSIDKADLPEETKKYLRTLVEQGKLEKENFENAKKSLNEQIKLTRQLQAAKQDSLASKARTKARLEAIDKAELVGKSALSSELFELNPKYGPKRDDNPALALRGLSANSNISPNKKAQNFNEILNREYQGILRQIITEEKDAKEGLDLLINRFKELRLLSGGKEIGENNELRASIVNQLRTDITKVREAGTNITGDQFANNKEVIKYGEQWNTWQRTGAQTLDELANKAQRAAEKEDELRKSMEDARTVAAQNRATVENTADALNAEAGNLSKVSGEWADYRNALGSAVSQQQQIDSGFAQITSRLKYLLSFGSAFSFLRNQVKATFQDVQNLDKSFAQIAMVTKYSVNEMWQSYDQYAEMANRLGQSTNDVVQASALFYQQGLDTAEALKLTEDTMKLATLAGIDYSEATDLMTSALRGFHMEMDEGAHVTDVYSELAAHAAANVQEIAVAMSKTASIAQSAGMGLETTAAFLTQTIETTQESATNIGTAMKTVK